MTRIVAQPLTRESFAAFGDVIDIGRRQPLPDQWRQGRALPRARHRRGHRAERARADLDVRGTPYELPLKLTMVERHPFGSQAFIPLSPRPFLVVVCHDGDEGPASRMLSSPRPAKASTIRAISGTAC